MNPAAAATLGHRTPAQHQVARQHFGENLRAGLPFEEHRAAVILALRRLGQRHHVVRQFRDTTAQFGLARQMRGIHRVERHRIAQAHAVGRLSHGARPQKSNALRFAHFAALGVRQVQAAFAGVQFHV